MTLYSITDLISNMPPYLDLDAHAAPALAISYGTGGDFGSIQNIGTLPDWYTGFGLLGGSATVTIQTKTLTTSVSGGSGVALSINLADYTLSSLIAYINAQPGYAAVLSYGYGDFSSIQNVGTLPDWGTSSGLAGGGANGSISAISLMEVIAQPINPAVMLYQFTAPNWLFWMPLLWQLQQAQIDLAAGLNEMYLASGNGGFLDFWGSVYGGITRDSGELDDLYAERIAQEIIRPRLTTLALEQAVLQETGVAVEINASLSDVALRWSNGAWNRQVYATFPFYSAIFTVDASGSVNQALVGPVIERNRAAGVEPLYNYTAPREYGNVAVNPWLSVYPVRVS